MWKKKNKKFKRVLWPVVLSCLSACAPANYNPACPIYPIAGSAVAAELEQAGVLPATWEWIGRIDKLRQELAVCQTVL